MPAATLTPAANTPSHTTPGSRYKLTKIAVHIGPNIPRGDIRLVLANRMCGCETPNCAVATQRWLHDNRCRAALLLRGYCGAASLPPLDPAPSQFAFVMMRGAAAQTKALATRRRHLAKLKTPKLTMFCDLPISAIAQDQKFLLRDQARASGPQE